MKFILADVEPSERDRSKAAVVLQGDATSTLSLLLAELTASGFERSRWGKRKAVRGNKEGKGGCGAAGRCHLHSVAVAGRVDCQWF